MTTPRLDQVVHSYVTSLFLLRFGVLCRHLGQSPVVPLHRTYEPPLPVMLSFPWYVWIRTFSADVNDDAAVLYKKSFQANCGAQALQYCVDVFDSEGLYMCFGQQQPQRRLDLVIRFPQKHLRIRPSFCPHALCQSSLLYEALQ